jgi:hypothetical protein
MDEAAMKVAEHRYRNGYDGGKEEADHAQIRARRRPSRTHPAERRPVVPRSDEEEAGHAHIRWGGGRLCLDPVRRRPATLTSAGRRPAMPRSGEEEAGRAHIRWGGGRLRLDPVRRRPVALTSEGRRLAVPRSGEEEAGRAHIPRALLRHGWWRAGPPPVRVA